MIVPPTSLNRVHSFSLFLFECFLLISRWRNPQAMQLIEMRIADLERDDTKIREITLDAET